MNLLIIDTGNGGLDLAIRSQHAGHKVKLFIRHTKDGYRMEAGDGLVERVPHWEAHMNWADLIFCTDNNFYIHALERFRDNGYPIMGPSMDTAKWEQKRDVGEMILNKCGIETIPSQKFSKYDDAIAYVMKNPKRYVSKPIGDGEKSLSYVAKSAADMVYMLKYWKKKNSYKGEFILQEFHGGVEFGVGGWFGPGGFNKYWCEGFEHKKLMNGELGVATGEMGTVLRYTEDSKLADEVLKPLEDYLHGLGYTGYVDVNCIIDKDGKVWPLEFTMRPGWPLFQIQTRLHRGDPIEWMADLLDGRDTMKVSKKVGCGVIIAIPDFPYSRLTKRDCSGYPLFGLTEEDTVTDVHLSEVQWGKAPAMVNDKVKLDVPMYVTAGDYICTVTGEGNTVCEAAANTYDTIKKKIEIPNSIMYRTDIGEKVEKFLPELQRHGYCTGMQYGEEDE